MTSDLADAAVTRHAGGGFFARVARRWWIVAIAVAAAVVVAFVYLAMATPMYSVTAVLASVAAKNTPPDEFLAAQRDVLMSKEVLAAAAGSPADQQMLSEGLRIRMDKGQGTLAVALTSPRPQQAQLALSRLIDAYLKRADQNQVVSV